MDIERSADGNTQEHTASCGGVRVISAKVGCILWVRPKQLDAIYEDHF